MASGAWKSVIKKGGKSQILVFKGGKSQYASASLNPVKSKYIVAMLSSSYNYLHLCKFH